MRCIELLLTNTRQGSCLLVEDRIKAAQLPIETGALQVRGSILVGSLLLKRLSRVIAAAAPALEGVASARFVLVVVLIT